MFGFGKPNVEKMERKKDIEGLIKALGYEKDTGVRSKAAIALGNIRDVFAFEPLIKALHDPESIVRGNAAEALGKIGDQRAVEPLIQSLYDSYIIVHSNAARALDNIGWKPGKDKNTARYWIVKKEWTKCVEIGVPAVESLICVLDYYDDNARLQATKALGKIGDARAIDPLIKALDDSDNGVRSSAACALNKIGPSVLESLIKALDNSDCWVRSRTVRALGKIGDARAVELLIKALHDPEYIVRGDAAEALGKIGDERAVEPLIKALHDSNADVRARVAEALHNFSNQTAVSALKEYEEQKKKKSHARESHDRNILDTLGRLCDAYANNDEYMISKLEPVAREIGKELDREGGIGEMRRIFSMLGDRRGSRTLEMHWGGIGDWWG